MKSKKDLIVALICIAFLLANIAAIGPGGRRRAREAACLSNLMKWGQVFQIYTAGNNGYFHSREVGSPSGYLRTWNLVYEPYYHDRMMLCCPAADNPRRDLGAFGTWGGPAWDEAVAPEFGYWVPINSDGEIDPTMYGSYGINRSVPNLLGVAFAGARLWRRAGVKGAENVPVLLDCIYVTLWYDEENQPPEYDGDIYQGDGISYSCINRHNGHVNVCFMDFSARKVGLKELWTLKGHRLSDTCGPWTICGFGGDEEACADAWDDAAPWMSEFPEY